MWNNTIINIKRNINKKTGVDGLNLLHQSFDNLSESDLNVVFGKMKITHIQVF